MNVDTGEARHRQSRESRDEAWEGATIQSPGTTQSLVNLEMLFRPHQSKVIKKVGTTFLGVFAGLNNYFQILPSS